MARAFSLAHAGVRRRWARWRRVLAIGVAVFLLGMIALGLAARSRAREAPGWWSPPVGAAAAQAAERAEQAVLNETHRVRTADGAWTLELSEEDANAWLALRLPEWLASQQPPLNLGGVGRVQVLLRPGLTVVAAEVGGGEPRVFSLGVEPAMDDQGRLVLTARSASLGRLGLPVGWVLRAVGQAGGAWKEASSSGRLVVEKPLIKLADGRRVRVVGVECVEGGLRVTCRTGEGP